MSQVLRHLPKTTGHPNLLVGNETSDDAGVYKLSDDIAIIQTVDYFTPIVDDPYMFGQIAAANALSDVYAMGGTPITAMNIVGFPVKKLGGEILAEILRGASDKVLEAGAITIGGHSIDDQEPKFGLSVTGTIHPDKIWKNIGAKVGEVLVITKPIGTGIISTGIKREMVSPELEKLAEHHMAKLNKEACEKARPYSPSAVTDVTGFGLLGHAYEMVRDSEVSLEIKYSDVPMYKEIPSLAEAGAIPGGSKANFNWLKNHLSFADDVSEIERYILCDALTSGGLLLSMTPEAASKYCEELDGAVIIGKVIPKQNTEIIVVK